MKQIASNLLGRVSPKSRFVRSVSVLVGGTAGGQAILVLAAPVLTRLYAPQDFGLLAVFAGLLSLFSVVACLRYELMIPLPDDEKDAAALFLLSLLSLLVVTALSALLFFTCGTTIVRMLNTPQLGDYLYLLPLSIFLFGAYNALHYWAIRAKEFTLLAKTKLGQAIAAVGIQLAGAPFGPTALLFGQVAGFSAGSLSLGRHVLLPTWSLVTAVKRADIVRVARRYKNAPLHSSWGALFNMAGWQLPAILFAVLFDPAAAGIYALANRVLHMPMQLVGQATGSVFFSHAAQAEREGKLSGLVARIHRRLAHIGMAPTLVLLFAGPELFTLVFGPEWRQAGVFAQWLAPWLYLVLLTSPLSPLFDVLGRQAIGSAYQAVHLVVRAAAIAGGAMIGDAMTAVALFAVGNAACSLASLAWIIRASGNRWREIWQPTLGALVWSLALVSPVIATSVWGIGGHMWFLALAATAVFVSVRFACLVKGAGA
ncbi:MAG: polysaccharide biosynthesis protein [Burkholderia sp.]|nr:polysaccharide biosynthesis protein [Burkholderia sp.]